MAKLLGTRYSLFTKLSTNDRIFHLIFSDIFIPASILHNTSWMRKMGDSAKKSSVIYGSRRAFVPSFNPFCLLCVGIERNNNTANQLRAGRQN